MGRPIIRGALRAFRTALVDDTHSALPPSPVDEALPPGAVSSEMAR